VTALFRAGFAAVCALAVIAQAPARPAFQLVGPMTQGGLLVGTAPAGTARLTLDDAAVPLASDGRFLIAFDRDQGAAATLIAELADGSRTAQTLRIAPRAWRIEHVNVARRPGGATAEYLRLREGELKRIEAARAAASPTDGWRQRFAWPARGRISGQFGSQRIYRGEPAAYHSGVDVAAGAGAPVVAPADGMVVLAGPPALSLEGNLIVIDHGMGLNSAFLHLATQAVRVGQIVRQGQLIGTVGASGRATGPHLHWSIKWNDARLDPALLAGPMPAP
jgi:murein DD-endopeptidase MepM/ murein hydrolase activator NlpD